MPGKPGGIPPSGGSPHWTKVTRPELLRAISHERLSRTYSTYRGNPEIKHPAKPPRPIEELWPPHKNLNKASAPEIRSFARELRMRLMLEAKDGVPWPAPLSISSWIKSMEKTQDKIASALDKNQLEVALAASELQKALTYPLEALGFFFLPVRFFNRTYKLAERAGKIKIAQPKNQRANRLFFNLVKSMKAMGSSSSALVDAYRDFSSRAQAHYTLKTIQNLIPDTPETLQIFFEQLKRDVLEDYETSHEKLAGVCERRAERYKKYPWKVEDWKASLPRAKHALLRLWVNLLKRGHQEAIAFARENMHLLRRAEFLDAHPEFFLFLLPEEELTQGHVQSIQLEIAKSIADLYFPEEGLPPSTPPDFTILRTLLLIMAFQHEKFDPSWLNYSLGETLLSPGQIRKLGAACQEAYPQLSVRLAMAHETIEDIIEDTKMPKNQVPWLIEVFREVLNLPAFEYIKDPNRGIPDSIDLF